MDTVEKVSNTLKTKKTIIIICCAIAVVSFLLGYLVGGLNGSGVAGVYRCDDWNGDETVVLLLNKDGSCRLPSGRVGTWTREGDKVVMTYDGYDGSTSTDTGTIAGDNVGVVLYGRFFEKIG